MIKAQELANDFAIVSKYCGDNMGQINKEEVETRLIFEHDKKIRVLKKDRYSLNHVFYVPETRHFILEL